MEQLIQMLRNHDFTFMYSEDHDLWMKSFAHISAIKQEICNLIASGEKLDELSQVRWQLKGLLICS